MLTEREVYYPESRMQEFVQTKDGPNLDGDLISAFAKVKEAMEVLIYKSLGLRSFDIDVRTVGPLFSANLLSMDIFNAYTRLSYYAGIAGRGPKPIAGRTVSRYSKPTDPESRMPGSSVSLDKKEMANLLSEAKRVEKAIAKARKNLDRPKTQALLRRAIKAH